MTEQELQQKINDINRESVSNDEKQSRIRTVNEIYANYQKRITEQERARQQTAEAELKSSLKRAYMSDPVATEADFERDYPQLKSEYLRSQTFKKDAAAREASARSMKNNF
jgi:hypothetical protein